MVNLSNIRVAFGERVIFDNGNFLLRPGDKVGLVGPNGAGKTTLFKVICGIEKPDDGTVSMDPGTVVGYFSQEVGEMSGRSALEEVLAGAGRVYELGREISRLEHRMSDAKGTERFSTSSSTSTATSWRTARRQSSPAWASGKTGFACQ